MIELRCPLCRALVARVEGAPGTRVEARCRSCRSRAIISWCIEQTARGPRAVCLTLDKAPAGVVA